MRPIASKRWEAHNLLMFHPIMSVVQMRISQKSSNHYHVCSAHHYPSVNPLHEALGTIPELAASEACHPGDKGQRRTRNHKAQHCSLDGT
jgi:hypothetical protein